MFPSALRNGRRRTVVHQIDTRHERFRCSDVTHDFSQKVAIQLGQIPAAQLKQASIDFRVGFRQFSDVPDESVLAVDARFCWKTADVWIDKAQEKVVGRWRPELRESAGPDVIKLLEGVWR